MSCWVSKFLLSPSLGSQSTIHAGLQKKLRHPIRPAEDVIRTMRGHYRNKHNSLNGTTVKPENKGSSNFDSEIHVAFENFYFNLNLKHCSWFVP
jgi:hypothetical protein